MRYVWPTTVGVFIIFFSLTFSGATTEGAPLPLKIVGSAIVGAGIAAGLMGLVSYVRHKLGTHGPGSSSK